MSAEIALRQDTSPEISYIPDAAMGLIQWAQSAEAAYELAKRIITTSFAPAQYRGKPDEAAAAMLAGAEVGLSPMASLRSFDVIQGVAAPRAIALRAIVQSLGHEIIIDEATPERVVGRGRRKGSKEWQRCEWTIKRAAQLGLTNKEQWKKQPQTMLIARFTSEIARLIAADAILGIPNETTEELLDAEQPTTTVTRIAPAAAPKTTVRRKPAAPAEPEEPAFDEPPAEEPEPKTQSTDYVPEELIRPQQMKLMMKLFNEHGFTGRDDRLDYVRDIVGIDIASSKDLTVADASRVIDALDRLDSEDGEPDAG